jgi:hypothetical protein
MRATDTCGQRGSLIGSNALQTFNFKLLIVQKLSPRRG